LWKHHWIYWVGPFLGATIAAVIYNLIFLKPQARAGTQGGGIDEVTPGKLLQELKAIKKMLKAAKAHDAEHGTDMQLKYIVNSPV
jgi:hypothetical protein